MDTLAHGLYGAALLAPTRDQRLMMVAGVVGMLPDLVVQGTIIVQTGLVSGLKIMGGAGEGFPTDLISFYRWTHSLLAVAVLAGFLLVFKRKYLALGLPYALHIFFDIFTHCGVFGTRIFFPFSDWHVCGVNYAESLWFWELNYGFLVGIYFMINWKFYRPFLKT